MGKIRVLIVDDHMIVREGLRRLMNGEPDIEVVGEAKDGEEAVSKTRELQPDVVLMDITMPGVDGFEATRRINREHPSVRILMLTVHESEEIFFKALESGASGYFVKGGSSSDLFSAIKMISQGETFLHPTVAKKLVNHYLRGAKLGEDKNNYDELSEREKQVLKLVADGRDNREIARILNISPNTVQAHRARMMIRLGLHGRSDLVKYAVRRGIIS